jgi:ketosteroid isomerase-like protein
VSEENLEIVRNGFALMRIPGDPEAMIAASSPTFEMRLTGVTGEPVHYTGASGIREFFRDVARSWEFFHFDATHIRDLGDDRVLVLGDVQGRGRVSGVEVADRWGLIIELKEGKVASARGFLDQREALEAAGLDGRLDIGDRH